MRMVLDVENTTVTRNGTLYLDPFEEENSLVMVGILPENEDQQVFVFDHSDLPPTENGREKLQR